MGITNSQGGNEIRKYYRATKKFDLDPIRMLLRPDAGDGSSLELCCTLSVPLLVDSSWALGHVAEIGVTFDWF